MEMGMSNKRLVIIEAFVLMIILQAVMEIAEWLISPLLPDTRFAAKMLNMVLVILLTVAVIIFAKSRKQELSVFPKEFSKPYVAATCITVILYIIAPSNFTTGLVSVMNIVYGSIFTPVYEELLFRGYIWNRFKDVTGSETGIYVWNIVLFAIWHIGYMVPNIISGNWFAVITKVAAGAVYGAILGFIRIKTRNCWSTILVHGVLNLVVI